MVNVDNDRYIVLVTQVKADVLKRLDQYTSHRSLKPPFLQQIGHCVQCTVKY